MTLLIKRFFAFIIIATLPFHAFSQPKKSALSIYNSGVSLKKRDPGKSFQLLERARQLAKENKEWDIYIQSTNELASLSFNLGEEKQKLSEEEQKAVFNWIKEALKNPEASKKTNAVAKLHFNAGEFYRRLTNEIDLPIYHYEMAHRIWTSLGGDSIKQIANCYHDIGDIYKYKKSDFLEAENAYEKALQLRESIDFQDWKVLFANYYSLATTNRSQRDFEKALSYGSKTLDIAKKLKKSIYPEMTNGVIAGIYRDMGESTLAKKHYQIAIALNKQTQDSKTLAWYYQGLGETFKNDSSYDDAIESFSKAYAIYKAEKVSSNLLVYLLQLMGETYGLKEDEKNFYKTRDELFNEFESSGMMKSLQASESFIIFGDYHFRKKNYDSALVYYQKGLIAYIPSFHAEKVEDNPSEGMIGFKYHAYRVLAKKASAFKQKFLNFGDTSYWHNAIRCLRLSEKLLSNERNMLDMQDAKWEFLQTNYEIYEDIISLLYEQDQIINDDSLFALAFQYFERSKARTIAEALEETERTLQINRKDSLFSIHTALRRNLLAAQDKLATESENNNNTETISKLHSEIVDLDKQIQSCKLRIEEKYPGYFNVKYGYHPATLENLDELIGQGDKVILEYFWGKEWVYGLGIFKDGVLFERIGKADEIQSHAHLLLSHFDKTHSSMNYEEYKNFTTSAFQLYRTLIGPFKKIISGEQHLQIIPDGPLSQVPFEILLEEKPINKNVDYRSLKYMIKSFNIGYAYSSATLAVKAKRSARKPTLLAVGFTGGDFRENSELVDIAGSREELELLQQQFNSGKFLTGDEATEANFKAMSPNFDIIHLAIHGRGNIKKNFGASLYFKSNHDSIDDGELHAYELYGLKLKALMAVLTACESGLGKDYKGEGMISMASAFTYSGCENILMSLWKVNDQASKDLMNAFYSQLLGGATIDHALRQAKLNYLTSADELTADPFVWAPLVAYGSLGKVFETSKMTYIVIASIGFLALLIFFVRKRKTT